MEEYPTAQVRHAAVLASCLISRLAPAGNIADVFHTFFGVAGLSLLGYPGFKQIDPVFALPVHVIQRIGIPTLYSTR